MCVISASSTARAGPHWLLDGPWENVPSGPSHAESRRARFAYNIQFAACRTPPASTAVRRAVAREIHRFADTAHAWAQRSRPVALAGEFGRVFASGLSGSSFVCPGECPRRRARAAPRHQPDADEVSVTLSETPTHRPARRQRRTCVAGARAAVYRPVRSSLVALRGIYSALLLPSTRCATHLASNLASGPADLPSGGSGNLASGSAYGPLCFARRATCSPSGRHTICHDSSP